MVGGGGSVVLSTSGRSEQKLRFYIVHTQGTQVAKTVHPAVCRCVPPYMKVFDMLD